MQNKKPARLIRSMLKTGLIGFGGGASLIPVIENEIVTQSGLVTEDEFNKHVMIASITPGALPVEIAAGIGLKTGGSKGSVAAATAMALPGAFLTLLLLVLFSGMNEYLRSQIGFISAAISVYIILILVKYVIETVKQAGSRREKMIFLFVLLGVFALSGEKNIYQLLGLSLTPVFSISAPRILAAAFFVILFTKGQLRRMKRSIPALLVALCYFLCTGQSHILWAGMEPFLLGLMLILAAGGFLQAISETKHKKQFPLNQASHTVVCWLLFALLLSLPALVLTRKVFFLLGTGFLSSVMSFGGGDAYLSIAQGLFVDNDVISRADFYGNIITVANALPGSILCKVLTGIGYTVGYEINHSAIEGIFMAISGFACSVASSGVIYTLVWAIYEKYEDLQVFHLLKRFVRPIISGLLLNVAISLYLSGIRPQFEREAPAAITILAALLIVAGNLKLLLSKRSGKS